MPEQESETELSRALARLEAALQSHAELRRETYAHDFVTIWVEPRNPNARAIWLSYMGDDIIVEVGEHGGRYELRRNAEDVAFLVDLVESVMAGRVRETVGPGRSMVEVTLANGTTIRETGYVSSLPRPGWKRRGKKIQYEPYST